MNLHLTVQYIAFCCRRRNNHEEVAKYTPCHSALILRPHKPLYTGAHTRLSNSLLVNQTPTTNPPHSSSISRAILFSILFISSFLNTRFPTPINTSIFSRRILPRSRLINAAFTPKPGK
jgi:hypothetical protein